MPPRKLTAAQLLELASSGAKIKQSDVPIIIENFDELVTAMRGLVDAGDKKSEENGKLIASFGELLKKLDASMKAGSSVDMAPMTTILTQIQKNTENRPLIGFDLTFKRTPRGLMTTARAMPFVVNGE